MTTIQFRKQSLVITDPQRRVYNGQPFSSELQWTPWADRERGIASERAEKRLEFWRELNEYSCKNGGEKIEYRVMPDAEAPKVPAGYTAEELERDNPYNAWMNEQ